MPRHWPLYLMEAAELAAFMISACIFSVILFHPGSPVVGAIPKPLLRRACMGFAMGLTAVAIIKSPWGQRSGAQFNPSITLTFLYLGKIAPLDAAWYIAAHLAGGIFGVGLSALLLGRSLASPAVEYAVTVPGPAGTAAAFAAELFMAALLMTMVLITSSRKNLAAYTTPLVGTLIFFYILIFAPISGFSINPARTVGSAVFAHVWTAIWVYFAAPILGMMGSAVIYTRCADTEKHYFTHRHLEQKPAEPATA